MATFTSSHADGTAYYKHSGPLTIAGKYAMTATASATDVFQLVNLQAGARVVGIQTWADTATMTYSVGDGDTTDRYMGTASGLLTNAATSIGVLSVFRDINKSTGFCYSTSATDTIDLRCDAAGGGATTTIYYVVTACWDSAESI
jgi:hypothetical protein